MNERQRIAAPMMERPPEDVPLRYKNENGEIIYEYLDAADKAITEGAESK